MDRQTRTDRDTNIQNRYKERKQGVERQEDCLQTSYVLKDGSRIIHNKKSTGNQSVNQSTKTINKQEHQGNTFGFLLLVYSIIKFLIIQKSIKYLC